jgi:tRNA A-37 threonylcarbamoyl transferase component Bud32
MFHLQVGAGSSSRAREPGESAAFSQVRPSGLYSTLMDSQPIEDSGTRPPDRPSDSDLTQAMAATPGALPSKPDGTETVAAPIQAGSVLKDRYRIVSELSSGGFGKVFLAQDQQLHNRQVVVKIQLDRAIEDPWMERKFKEEAQALAMIDHPGVVGALDCAQTADGRPFLVMQYVEGKPLRAVMTADGLPLERAANIIRQIGQALGAAHEKKIWHRDLKPDNIMLQVLPGGDEHVRLIDFGLATIADLATGQTHTRVAGSVAYMAPEQFSGQPSVSTDIYAFGVIAYEMVTGRKPFPAESAVQHMVMQQSGVRIKPSALRPGISNQVESLILHALSYNPNERPVRANTFGDALSHALLNSQSTQTMEIAATQTKRRRLGWLAGTLAVVLAAGALWALRGRVFPARPESAGQANAAVPAAAPKSGPDASDAEVELAFWNSIGTSTDPRLYRDYLAKYPNGKFASVAKVKLDELTTKAADPHRPAPSATQAPPSPDSAVQPPAAGVRTPKGLPPPRPMLKPDDYSGPLRGELSWAGTLGPGATLTIQGGKAISGDLTGDLPRVPITVESLTNGVSVVEQPSAANQWDQVAVRNASSAPVGGFQIRWRVAR